MLDGSLVFDELCVDKVDETCWFSVINCLYYLGFDQVLIPKINQFFL